MKTKTIIVMLTALLYSCTKETPVTISCNDTAPSFASEVNPVFKQKCISCHGSKGEHGVSLNTYDAVYSNASAARRIFSNSNDHQGVSLSSSDRNIVCCWIDSGAPNN